ncbi:hypothetical protein F5X99DRAFT_392253 [Biscogniauxia marginata]|nr:hypothetical protein F5X99DRAFT_392253 [Biscogniauxia marginata]
MVSFRRTLVLSLGLAVPGLASPTTVGNVTGNATTYTNADSQTVTLPTTTMATSTRPMSPTSQLAPTHSFDSTERLCKVGTKKCHGKHIQMCNGDQWWEN